MAKTREEVRLVKRHKGFVVAGDLISGRVIWKVRVKDLNSSYNSRKFVVASVHDKIELARGLNVNFMIGELDSEKGKTLRAVDVRLQDPADKNFNQKGQEEKWTK